MLIISCDYHPGFQQIAFVDCESGEIGERRLLHREEAEQFYRKLKEQNVPVRVGMEASEHARWFERLLQEMQFELWIGNAAEIRTKRVRKHEDRPSGRAVVVAAMIEGRFPRIWVADRENGNHARGWGSKRWLGRTEFRTLKIRSEPSWNAQTIHESEMALLIECMLSCSSETA